MSNIIMILYCYNIGLVLVIVWFCMWKYASLHASIGVV